MKGVFEKVIWLGKRTVFMAGLAVILALVFGVASTALGANGGSFILGKATNTATKVTGLIGKVATGSALVVKNPSGGSALNLQVNGGKAPIKVNPEAGTATNLSADELDGEDASAYQRRVSGECAAGSAIRSVGVDGATVACEPDDDGGAAVQSFEAELGTADRGPNEADDLVSYTRLKDVPDGILSRDADTLDGRDSTQFAGTSHAHSGGDITSGTVAGARIDGAIARDAEILPAVKANDGAGSGLDSDTLDGKSSDDFASAYKRTVIVSPVGTAMQNGTALKNALIGITSASATNPYLLKIEPGVYDVGGSNTPLQMKSWVDIEGSGEGVTTITASGSNFPYNATVEGASNAELRFLTVKNTGGTDYATAIAVGAGPFRLTQVTASASGGSHTSTSLQLCCGAAVVLDGVAASAQGSNRNVGVQAVSNADVTLNEVTIEASGGTFDRGIENDSGIVEVNRSTISSGQLPIRNLATTRVGASQLNGPPVLNQGGTLTCAGVYDEDYTFFANTCP